MYVNNNNNNNNEVEENIKWLQTDNTAFSGRPELKTNVCDISEALSEFSLYSTSEDE